MMTDKFLMRLCPGWGLACDLNQWMLMRARNLRTESGWKPVAFIGSTKTLLRRVLRETGVTPYPEAEAIIDTWPERFLDWRAECDVQGDPAEPRARATGHRKAA